MKETLKIYTRSHDPARPLVCLDEASKQLTRETHKPLLQPATRGAERLPLSYIQQLDSDTGRPRLVLSRYFNSFEVVTTQVVLRLIRFSVSNNPGSCIWYEQCDLLRRCY